jgi:MFS family permease
VAPRFVRVFTATLRDPDIRRIELGYIAFNTAEWATWIAMLVYAYAQGGVVASGVVAVVQLVPAALFAPFGAALADRYPRGQILVLAYGAQSITVAATAAALVLDAPAVLVYLLAASAASAVTLTRPAQNGLLPLLARTPDALTAANAALGTIENASILIAPAVASVLLAFAGPGLVYAVMAAALALSAVVVAGVRTPTPAVALPALVEPSPGPRQALRILASDPRALALVVLLAGQALQVGALDVLFVVLALSVLGIGDAGVGLLNAALGLGGIVGALSAAVLAGRTTLPRWVAFGILLWGGGLAAIALLPSVTVVFALIAGAGAGRSLMDVAGRSLLQRVAPGAVLSSVFGVLEGGTMAALALGAALAPVLVQTFGVPNALVTVGAVLPILLVVALRTLLRLETLAPQSTRQLALLRAVPIFTPLPAPTLERVAAELEPVAARTGDVIVREGEAGDRFYLIDEGSVDVTIRAQPVRRLGPGEYFGEIALVRDVPRTATVTARSDVRLYSLRRTPFLAAARSRPASARAAEAIARSREP